MTNIRGWLLLAMSVVAVVISARGSGTVLFISGLLLFAAAAYSCYRRWDRIAIVDVYVFLAGIFFGALSMLDALINNISFANPYLTILVHFHVAVIVALILAVFSMLPADWQRAMRLRYLMDVLRGSRIGRVAFLAAFTIFVKLYGYFQYGIISRIPFDYFEGQYIMLPYWYTSFAMIAKILVIYNFCVSVTKITDKAEGNRFLWWVIMFVSVLLEVVDSRRGLFYLLVVGGAFWAIRKEVNPFRARYAWQWALMLLIMIGASNVFQTYRYQLLDPTLRSGLKDFTFTEALLNTDETLANLRGREATWRFNYRIFNGLRENPGLYLPLGLYGKMSLQAFKNVVPKAFLPYKEIIHTEELAAEEYGLLVMDYSGNIFANMCADWGILSVIIVPAVFYLLFGVYAFLARTAWANRWLPGILLAVIIVYIVNLENNIDDYLLLYRHLLLIGAIVAAEQSVSYLTRKAPHGHA